MSTTNATAALERARLAMEPFHESLKGLWGVHELEYLLHAVALTTAYAVESGRFLRQVPSEANSVVFVGERYLTEEQMGIAAGAVNQLPHGAGDRATLLFSGGIRHRASFGEFPAMKLADRFRNCGFRLRYDPKIVVEEMSMNTADQCKYLAFLAKEHGVRVFVLALPIEHITRFAAVLVCALRSVDVDEASASILPCSYSTWSRVMPSGLSAAREAFGPCDLLAGESPKLLEAAQQRAGQCGKRWYDSYYNRLQGIWPLGGVLPSTLRFFLEQQTIPLV